MVHGLGGSALNWTDLMGLLGDRLHAKAVDLPGFGYSPPAADGDYSVRAHASAVIAFIEADGRGPVHLFGNSLGGLISTLVAAARPDLVRSLVLVSPALPNLRPGRWRTEVAVLGTPFVGPMLTRRLAQMSVDRRVDGLFRLVFADPSVISPERRAEAGEEILRRATLPYAAQSMALSSRGLVETFLVRGPRSVWAQAATVTAPTLLIFGREDRLVPHQVGPKAASIFPDSQLVVLPRTGHVAQLEHPDIVDHFVREFLHSRVPAS
jgi:pimeloyl-ACP methyl ester carboxylesterase